MTDKRLGRNLFLGVKPRTMDITDIPGFEPDQFLTVRELSASAVKDITSKRGSKKEATYMSAMYVVHSVVDGNGDLILTEDDINTLRDQLGYKAMTYIVTEILKFNDLLDEDEPEGSDEGEEQS